MKYKAKEKYVKLEKTGSTTAAAAIKITMKL